MQKPVGINFKVTLVMKWEWVSNFISIIKVYGMVYTNCQEIDDGGST